MWSLRRSNRQSNWRNSSKVIAGPNFGRHRVTDIVRLFSFRSDSSPSGPAMELCHTFYLRYIINADLHSLARKLTVIGLETHWYHQQQHSPNNQSHPQRRECGLCHWYLLLGRLLRTTQALPHFQCQHVVMLHRNDHRPCKVLHRV